MGTIEETPTVTTEAIKKKINAFFKTKVSFSKRISFEGLQLYVDYKADNELNFYLFNGKTLIEDVALKDILDLSFIERAFTSEEKVLGTLYNALLGFSNELQVQKEFVQILIRSSNEYFVCINKNVDKKITINQIIS